MVCLLLYTFVHDDDWILWKQTNRLRVEQIVAIVSLMLFILFFLISDVVGDEIIQLGARPELGSREHLLDRDVLYINVVVDYWWSWCRFVYYRISLVLRRIKIRHRMGLLNNFFGLVNVR